MKATERFDWEVVGRYDVVVKPAERVENIRERWAISMRMKELEGDIEGENLWGDEEVGPLDFVLSWADDLDTLRGKVMNRAAMIEMERGRPAPRQRPYSRARAQAELGCGRGGPPAWCH